MPVRINAPMAKNIGGREAQRRPPFPRRIPSVKREQVMALLDEAKK
jgi:hypothetical protein